MIPNCFHWQIPTPMAEVNANEAMIRNLSTLENIAESVAKTVSLLNKILLDFLAKVVLYNSIIFQQSIQMCVLWQTLLAALGIDTWGSQDQLHKITEQAIWLKEVIPFSNKGFSLSYLSDWFGSQGLCS